MDTVLRVGKQTFKHCDNEILRAGYEHFISSWFLANSSMLYVIKDFCFKQLAVEMYTTVQRN